MDHDYIEESNIIDRFLMGKLSEDDSEDFQDHTMSCQRCLDDLAYAERLHRGIKRVYENDAARASAPLMLLAAWLGGLNPAKRGLLALAVVLAAAGPALLVGWRIQHLQGELVNMERRYERESGPLPNVPIFRLSSQRGGAAGRPATFPVRLGSSSQWLVLVLEVNAQEVGPLGARLLDEQDREVWVTSGLVVDDVGEITIGLHAGRLDEGDFFLILTGHTPGQSSFKVAQFSFRVVRTP